MNTSTKTLLVLLSMFYVSSAVALTCQGGIPPSNPSSVYTAHDNGTVTDIRTGLIWKTCSEGQTYSAGNCSGTATRYIWSEALTLAENTVYAQKDDWRLPTIQELQSLVENCRSNPSINTSVFPNTPHVYYTWTGSPNSTISWAAWQVGFGNGDSHSNNRGLNEYVRLVRGGQSFASFEGDASVVQAGSVTFLNENLPDGSYHIGTQSKIWRFEVGDQAIQGLKAVEVSTDTGLGIQTAEIVLGDVAAESTIEVSLPINASHVGQAVKQSTWRLVDESNKPVSITNSASDTFWLRLRTNRPPMFSPLQLNALGGRAGETVSLPVLTEDLDGDSLSFTVEGGGSVTNGVYSAVFDQAGVYEIVITVSDGRESASHQLQAVIYDSTGVSQLFSDVPFNGTSSENSLYSAIHYLAMNGIVIGAAGEGNTRLYEPDRTIYQAEALGMLLLASEKRGIVTLQDVDRELSNLVIIDPEAGVYQNFSWASPYALTAEALGLIDNASEWKPDAPVSRSDLSRWLSHLLDLQVPFVARQAVDYSFTDTEDFGTALDYQMALAASFFGYLGELGSQFGPNGLMSRGEFALAVSKLMRRPSIDSLNLQGTKLQAFSGQLINTAEVDDLVSLVDVDGLHSNAMMVINDTVQEEWISTPPDYVDLTLYLDEQLIDVRRISQLDSSPIPIDTSLDNGRITQDYLYTLTAVLRDVRSNIASIHQTPILITFPDRDGDGVKDDLDLWPDDSRFAFDNNATGYPDKVDLFLEKLGLIPSNLVTLNGIVQDYTHGFALMMGLPPYDGSSVSGDVQILVNQQGQGSIVANAEAYVNGDIASFELTPATGYRIKRHVGGNCALGEWISDSTYRTGQLSGHCSIEFRFDRRKRGLPVWLPAVVE